MAAPAVLDYIVVHELANVSGRAMQPDRDWTLPVWFDRALLDQFAADEKRLIEQVLRESDAEDEVGACNEADAAAVWIVRNGLAGLIERLKQPVYYEKYGLTMAQVLE